MIKSLAFAVVAFCAAGCADPDADLRAEAKRQYSLSLELPAGKKHAWQHDVGAGVPHRCTILNDGTEILTIGQYNHGEWVTLIRYKGQESFSVVPRSAEEELRKNLEE